MNTTYVYSPDPLEEALFLKMHKLLENYTPTLYSQKVHDHLRETYVYGVGYRKRDIILPMPTDVWESTNDCRNLISTYIERQAEWPEQSHYNYAMDYCAGSTKPGYLTFGYALCGDMLVPCAFFTNFLMTGTIDQLPGVPIPETYAIDPMAFHLEHEPECYIGVVVATDIVEEWLLSRGEKPHPLETHILGEDKKRAEEKNWEREIIMGPHSMLKEISDPETKNQVEKWLLKS
jgi:hypothetical protein